MAFLFSRLFPLPFILVGAGCLYMGVQGIERAKASVDWPQATGKIVASTVDRSTSTSGAGRNRRTSTSYSAEIEYSYAVDGASFTGDRVAYGDYGSSNRGHASGIVSRYPVGKQVAVYYMPDKPGESLLEPGMSVKAWFLPGFGLVFLVAGLAMAVGLPIAFAKQREAAANG